MSKYNIVEILDQLEQLSGAELNHVISAAEVELRERDLTIDDFGMSTYYDSAEKVFAISAEI